MSIYTHVLLVYMNIECEITITCLYFCNGYPVLLSQVLCAVRQVALCVLILLCVHVCVTKSITLPNSEF